eukprot:8998113-Prorocentrum_lima.AAC.1
MGARGNMEVFGTNAAGIAGSTEAFNVHGITMAYPAEGRAFDDVFEAFEATTRTGATAAGLGVS